MAFGEVGVKKRVRSVLSYQKAALWIVLTALIAGAALAVCFLTAPIPSGTAKTAPKAQAEANSFEPTLPLPEKLTKYRSGASEEPEPEEKDAPVYLNLLMSVDQQCDTAE